MMITTVQLLLQRVPCIESPQQTEIFPKHTHNTIHANVGEYCIILYGYMQCEYSGMCSI